MNVLFSGYGSVLNIDGEVEMDAIIMEGTQLKAGLCQVLTLNFFIILNC